MSEATRDTRATREFVTLPEAKRFREHEDFISVHRYPEGIQLGHREFGALMRDGVIYKRIFYA